MAEEGWCLAAVLRDGDWRVLGGVWAGGERGRGKTREYPRATPDLWGCPVPAALRGGVWPRSRGRPPAPPHAKRRNGRPRMRQPLVQLSARLLTVSRAPPSPGVRFACRLAPPPRRRVRRPPRPAAASSVYGHGTSAAPTAAVPALPLAAGGAGGATPPLRGGARCCDQPCVSTAVCRSVRDPIGLKNRQPKVKLLWPASRGRPCVC